MSVFSFPQSIQNAHLSSVGPVESGAISGCTSDEEELLHSFHSDVVSVCRIDLNVPVRRLTQRDYGTVTFILIYLIRKTCK